MLVFWVDSDLDNNVRLRCFFQAEDGIRYLVRSRGLGDVYKRQVVHLHKHLSDNPQGPRPQHPGRQTGK